jgi:hypothetical protein
MLVHIPHISNLYAEQQAERDTGQEKGHVFNHHHAQTGSKKQILPKLERTPCRARAVLTTLYAVAANRPTRRWLRPAPPQWKQTDLRLNYLPGCTRYPHI